MNNCALSRHHRRPRPRTPAGPSSCHRPSDALVTQKPAQPILSFMPQHQHMLDGKSRPITLAELKEFVDAATSNGTDGKRPLHAEIVSGKIKKIWIDLSGPNK